MAGWGAVLEGVRLCGVELVRALATRGCPARDHAGGACITGRSEMMALHTAVSVIQRTAPGVTPVWRLKARLNAASEPYPTCAATVAMGCRS